MNQTLHRQPETKWLKVKGPWINSWNHFLESLPLKVWFAFKVYCQKQSWADLMNFPISVKYVFLFLQYKVDRLIFFTRRCDSSVVQRSYYVRTCCSLCNFSCQATKSEKLVLTSNFLPNLRRVKNISLSIIISHILFLGYDNVNFIYKKPSSINHH